MNGKQVFSYRNWTAVLTPLLSLAVFAGVAWLSTHLDGPMTVNGLPATQDDIAFAKFCFALLTVFLAWLFVRQSLGVWNERIEIQDGEIRWFNSLGKLAVKAPLASAGRPKHRGSGRNRGDVHIGAQAITVSTDSGKIKFSDSIADYDLLIHRILTEGTCKADVIASQT